MRSGTCLSLLGSLAMLSMPAGAAVSIQSVVPSPAPPQLIGAVIHWSATATDTGAGPLTFQFNIAPPGGKMAMVKDFNLGSLNSGTWTAPAFEWMPTAGEGKYQIQVVAKDFASGERAASTFTFLVKPLVTGATPVVIPTANPLVALFSAPACAAGSRMRVEFTKHGASSGTTTPWAECNPAKTMNFEIAGMYQTSTYTMFSQTATNGKVVDGPPVSFTTGPLPSGSLFPTITVNVPAGPDTDKERVILADTTMPGQGYNFPELAADASGRIIWYYYPATSADLLTRPLSDGILMIQGGPAWNPGTQQNQLLRKIDWAGNIVKETNTGAIQQELLALGAADAQPCTAIPKPPPVGAACLGQFGHEFIHSLPNGYSATIAEIEKIYPAGTQGDNSGLPVDIIGDMIVVLDDNWQAVWYFDTFEHAGGPPQLEINRAAVLHETCGVNQTGCPPIFLLGEGIAPMANDWLHANSLYYWPAPQNGTAKGDLLWSSRHQDWVMRVDYQDGTGTGNILWRMGPDGDWAFNNVNGDPWPWFSHQHEAAIEEANGYLDLFDNGNTRLALLSSACGPADCDSRGMVLQLDEAHLQATPVLSVDLGVYSSAVGSAQLLDNGDYSFMAGFVGNLHGYFIEILPEAGTITGSQVFNWESTMSYRAWRMSSLYEPPSS